MSDSHDTRSARWHPGAALALAAGSAAVPVQALLFQRDEISADLGLREPLVGESLLVAVVAIAAALAWLTIARHFGPRPSILGGSVACGIGWLIAAGSSDVALFLLGVLIAALGTAAIAVSHRPLLVSLYGPTTTHRAVSRWWAAVGVGAASTLAISVAEPVDWTTSLTIAGIASLVSTLLLGLCGRQFVTNCDRTGIRSVRTPWVRRSTLAALAAGLLVFAGSEAVIEVLEVKWELNPEGFAAVLAAAAGGFVGASLLAHWYVDLSELDRGQRAHIVGTGLLLSGGLAVLGASSFTYVGLVLAWVGAGAALGVVAVALDLATLPDLAAGTRWQACALSFTALLGGALIGVALLAGPMDSVDADIRLGVLAAPLFLLGLLTVFRAGDSPRITAPTEPEAAVAVTAAELPQATRYRPEPLLVCSGVEVSYGRVQALFGVDLTVGEAEIVALLGANGAGKTTILRAISGLEQLQNGRVLFAGVDIGEMPATWRVGLGISQVVGGDAVVESLSVAENLRLYGHNLSRQRRQAGTERVFDVFPRLKDRSNQAAATLSGGEKQMLGLAKAVMVKPRLLVIDEFSLGLAPVIISGLFPVMSALNDAGTAILLVEQGVDTALELADHVYCMEKGRIVYEGSSAQLAASPETLQKVLVEGISRALEH